MFDLEKFMTEVHQVAVDKGWYDPDAHIKTDLENHMLMVSEIAEASEEVRNNKPPMYQGPGGKWEGEAVELADVILRILDYTYYKKLPLIEALKNKHEYNRTRPYRHGGKKL